MPGSTRGDLPTGTVTFLFSDIEGSTRALQELGADAYAAALAQHREIVRETVAAHAGVEVDTQGDAFFVAFATASDAVDAASAIRDRLAGEPVQARVGIHTGSPLVTPDGYVGEDVHRAARIAAVGSGGQILVSRSTADLLGDADLRDLGAHRLKDLSATERIYQVGQASFPPLRTLYRSNLPTPATPFLGRESELTEVVATLARPEVRTLTLTGPGGTGKTRLAIQAAAAIADRMPDGVWWVPLAAIRDPRLVIESIRGVIGAGESVAEHIADRQMLLVLDNFEQVVDAAADVALVIAACPRLEVLVTSRERLAIDGEHVYPVPPLAPPEGAELFVARALSIDPAFAPDATVQDLCDRLDNLPLAIELAASRVGALSLEQIEQRLAGRLDLLRGGRDRDPRQQTIRATIEWSHDLLSGIEQATFARLAVFRGGWTLEAAEAVVEADVDVLQSLVDKSLVRRFDGRFSMLETIREFAKERLEASGEADETRRSHADWFLVLADSANLSLESIGRGRQNHAAVTAEIDNVRAAIDWATTADIELAMRLVVALENYWVTHDPDEGVRRVEVLLAQADGLEPLLLARAYRDLGGCSQMAGDIETAQQAYERSLELFRLAGDEARVWHLVHRLGSNASSRGDYETARRLFAESRAGAAAIGDTIGELQVLGSLGSIELYDGDPELALTYMTASLEMARDIGWTWWEANQRSAIAEALLRLGRFDDAEPYAKVGLSLSLEVGDREGIIYGLGQAAWIAAARGDGPRAGTLWLSLEEETRRTPLPMWARDRQTYQVGVGAIDAAATAIRVEDAVRLALGPQAEPVT